MRRRFLLGTAGLLALPLSSAAQTFPDHPVRFVVPYAPGGSTDTSTRIIAEKLSTMFGQQVIVDNKPGGATIIGTEVVAKAKPDGYTLLLTPGALAEMPRSASRCLTTRSRTWRRSRVLSTCRCCWLRTTTRRSSRLPS